MPMPSPQQFAKNWKNGMSGSSEKFKAGVGAVTDNPAQKAIAAIDRQVAGVIRAAQDGSTARGLGRVTLEDWKRNMLEKGAARISAGAAAAENKVAAFAAEFLPYLASGVAGLPPRGGLEDNIARSAQMQRYNANFKRSR